MEVAGVVLGAIPIALYALDNYNRCLTVAKDVIRYQATLETFRLHIFIQRQQLLVTLRNIGMPLAHDRLPDKTELKSHLERLYPESNAEFMSIIAQMERHLATLLDKLDVDSRGKPQWTTDPPERAAWNWRRIRRGLGGSERDDIVQKLQYWNTALSKVFEKPEIPADEDGPLVESLQSRFDSTACNSIRRHVNCVYDAFTRIWQCDCLEHRANLVASWHADVGKAGHPGSLILAISSRDGMWQPLSVELEPREPASPQPVPELMESAALSLDSTTRVLKGKGKVRFWPSKKEIPVHTPVARALAAPAALALRPLNPTTPTLSVECLCNFLSSASHTTPGMLQCPDSGDVDAAKSLILRCVQASNDAPNSFLPLHAVLVHSPEQPRALSRRDRFSIAAAAAWAVLYLCGTPWLKEDDASWTASGAIHLGLAMGGAPNKQPLLGVPCSLKSQAPNTTNPQTPRDSQPKTLIRNRILFALGVLLTELCLNTTLDTIRWREEQPTRGGTPATTTTAQQLPVLDERVLYELADRQSDRVYLEAGQSYGYAVQRCLRCEFPGRDAVKSFDFERFRRDFFNGVVAPVHAVYTVQLG